MGEQHTSSKTVRAHCERISLTAIRVASIGRVHHVNACVTSTSELIDVEGHLQDTFKFIAAWVTSVDVAFEKFDDFFIGRKDSFKAKRNLAQDFHATATG